jgi:serine phosphatase RsbU (regulator of sigma subunit)/CheY-like chemotaxis protein
MEQKIEPLKLMVVDDEIDNLELLYRTFRREFQVFKAVSGQEALEILEQEGEMAIIISDQRMPLMNGTEFLSKTLESYPDTIRILLTGYIDIDYLVDAINAAKVFKYITKPCYPEDLYQVVLQGVDAYKLVKDRTTQLRRALKREELFNQIVSTIRESLDYQNTLKSIVRTIANSFETDLTAIVVLEPNIPLNKCFCYAQSTSDNLDNLRERDLETISQASVSRQTQQNEQPYLQLAIPLISHQEILAVLYLKRERAPQFWSDLDLEILEAVAFQAGLAISQAKLYQDLQQQTQKIRAELELARHIQDNLLPLPESWQELEGIDIQASYYPVNEVGGDFFEVYPHPKGDIWLAIGDVAGKGVPAALFMASAISLLRKELAGDTPLEPNVIIANLNASMLDNLSAANSFITLVVARYNCQSGKLVYANAGHVYPLVWSHQLLSEQKQKGLDQITIQPNYLEVRGIPIGILPNWQASTGEVTLKPGDIFLLASDGITEASTVTDGNLTIAKNKLMLLDREGLWQLLVQQNRPFKLERLFESFRQVTASLPEDDRTILSLEVL